MALEITREQFEGYKEVQSSGQYNMFDPNARMLTGLDKNTYLSIMKNYDELSKKYGKENKGEKWTTR